MAGHVYRRPQVDLDLVEIANYIARDNIDAALRFLDAAEATFETLAESPQRGRLSEFRSSRLQGVRRWRVKGFKNYLVFYRMVADGIEVIRVLHGARDVESLLDQQ